MPQLETDKELLKRVDDIIRQSVSRDIDKYTNFLSQREQALVSTYIAKLKVNHSFYGGYDTAERKVLGVPASYTEELDFPVKTVVFARDRFYEKVDITHRDVLGTLMSLQLNRNTIGDILVSRSEIVVFCHSTVFDVIKSDITRIGGVPVSVTGEQQTVEIAQEYELLEFSVASLRIDAILGRVCKVSREKALEIVKAKKVFLGGAPVEKGSVLLSEGCIFTVSGYGKFQLENVGGLTKKSRVNITIKKYK